MPVAALIFTAFAGLCVGSFLNVVAWRLPRNESVVRPGSHCPGCDRPLKAYENIPVFSWLVLRGRCRTCKTRISIRYPLIELTTGALYVAIAAYWWEDWRELALGIVLVTALIPITAIDLDVKRIPNAITAPAALLALPIAALTEPSFIPEQLIAGAAATFFFLLPALISRKGMGMGDVKLAGVMGLYLGAAVAPAILIALVSGTLIGVVVILKKGVSSGRKTAVPFGPFLALGAVVSIFAGTPIVDAYVGRF
ncbi:MAG: prepilin peptidase [Baekduia sp.]